MQNNAPDIDTQNGELHHLAPLILIITKGLGSHKCHSVETKSEKIVVKQRRSRGLSTSEGLVQECFDEC